MNAALSFKSIAARFLASLLPLRGADGDSTAKLAKARLRKATRAQMRAEAKANARPQGQARVVATVPSLAQQLAGTSSSIASASPSGSGRSVLITTNSTLAKPGSAKTTQTAKTASTTLTARPASAVSTAPTQSPRPEPTLEPTMLVARSPARVSPVQASAPAPQSDDILAMTGVKRIRTIAEVRADIARLRESAPERHLQPVRDFEPTMIISRAYAPTDFLGIESLPELPQRREVEPDYPATMVVRRTPASVAIRH